MGVISGWTEGILLVVAFVLVLSLGIAGLNSYYSTDYNTGLTSDNTMTNLRDTFTNYSKTSQADVQGGTILQGNILGINIVQSYKVLTGALNIVWTFISGAWISNLAVMVHLGEPAIIFASILQVVWFIGVIFALLYVFFKVII